MKRRSFMRSIALGSAGIPFASGFANTTGQESMPIWTEGIPRYEINDELCLKGFPKIDGLSSGVADIDEITNGFQRKQLICVYGPLDHVNTALTAGSVVHNVMKGHFVDFITTESSLDRYLEQVFQGTSPKFKKEMNQLLFDHGFGERAKLRLPPIDLGDPKNDGWKKYKEFAHKNPPELLYLDGVNWIELLLEEEDMARQLKDLATELNIPVIVHAPSQSASDQRATTEQRLRDDFARLGDVFISLIPKFVCDYRYGKTAAKEYILLDSAVCADWCPCPKHRQYSHALRLQFSEPFCQFKAV